MHTHTHTHARTRTHAHTHRHTKTHEDTRKYRQNVRVGGEMDGGREKKGENERIKRDEYKNKGIPYPKNLIKHEQGFLYMVLRRLGEG